MSEEKEIDFDIQIDEHRLDEEWLEQPRKYFRYAAKLADARRELDAAKAALDVTRAVTDRAIREDPAKFGLSKITEKSIEATVPVQKPCMEGQAAVIEARHDVDILQAAVGSLEQRRKALEHLVTLLMANYFASPRAPDGAKDRMREMEKKSVRRRGRRAAGE